MPGERGLQQGRQGFMLQWTLPDPSPQASRRARSSSEMIGQRGNPRRGGVENSMQQAHVLVGKPRDRRGFIEVCGVFEHDGSVVIRIDCHGEVELRSHAGRVQSATTAGRQNWSEPSGVLSILNMTPNSGARLGSRGNPNACTSCSNGMSWLLVGIEAGAAYLFENRAELRITAADRPARPACSEAFRSSPPNPGDADWRSERQYLYPCCPSDD
jgi:hypothetical protein